MRWLLLPFAVFGSYAVRPERITARSFGPSEQRLSLTASDGIRIAGTYLPAASADAPGVLLLHGVRSSRNQFVSQAQWLNAQGYAVLAIDFRGHGESQQVARSFGLFEARDARAAFDWLKRKQGGAPVAVIGTSLGGAAALLGERGPVPADALVLVAVYPTIRYAIRNRIAAFTASRVGELGEPFLSYQSYVRMGRWPEDISPIRAIPSFLAPVLIVGGGNDVYTPVSETRALFEAANGPKQLWLVENATHAEMGQDTQRFRDRLKDFLRSATTGDNPS